MLAEEDELMHALGLLLERSPALVNTRHPETGASLLHFAVQQDDLELLKYLTMRRLRVG